MIKFLDILFESPSDDAKKLGLWHIGYGHYVALGYNQQAKLVAVSRKGILKFVGKDKIEWENKLKQLNEVTFYPMYHGGVISFNRPIYFSNNKLVASSYGDAKFVYKITLKKPVVIDFSSAEAYWLPEKFAKIEAKKLGMELNDFDEYRGHKKFRDVKTDHFVQAAKDKGFDGVIFKNIMDMASLHVKGGKDIRATDVVAINPKKSVKYIKMLVEKNFIKNYDKISLMKF
jgi:hypothetical protein